MKLLEVEVEVMDQQKRVKVTKGKGEYVGPDMMCFVFNEPVEVHDDDDVCITFRGTLKEEYNEE